jgi:hypothetical protein
MTAEPITRFIKVKDVVTHFKVLKTAAEECDDYNWMRAGENAHICQHGEQIYPLILRNDGDALEIACGCPAWQYAHDNDGCKHIAAFLNRSTPPQKPITDAIAKDLMAIGWTGSKGNLQPPETTSDEADEILSAEPLPEPPNEDCSNCRNVTSDEDGEDNEGSDPVPDRAPKPTPAPTPEPGMLTGTCQYCGKKFERNNEANLKQIIKEHEATCTKRAKGNDVTQTAPEQQHEETKMAEQEEREMHGITKERVKDALDNMPIGSEETIKSMASKIYTHPDGTEFESAEALLSYAEKQKTSAPQTMARRVRHKPMIKGISPQLQEIGRIAVGEKGGLSKSGKTLLPTKLDHFIFTTLNKDEDDRYIRDADMMVMFGENCTEIPVRLLYNDIELNFPTFYAKYARSGIKLRGDGENWTVYGVDSSGNGTREEVFDPNNERGFLDDKDVKPHGILTVLVDGQDSVGGVFRFRTTSWNSINNILSSLALIKNMCGMLTYIPLKLVYRKKEVQPVGMSHKTWIPVVSVEFRGSIEELQTQAVEVQRLTSGTQREEMRQIEAAVREHLDEDESAEVQQDIASEYAPGVM